MSTFTISFGLNGSEEAWYLRKGSEGFTPIDIALLPGPKPSFSIGKQQIVVSYTQESFSGELLYKDRVKAQTTDGTTNVDQLPDWNTVKNVQLLSNSAQKMVLDGFVHVDAQLGITDSAATQLILNGTKRANVVTGLGDDVVDIRIVSDQNSVWVDDFRLATGAGKDTVLLSGLDIQKELAAGDYTFIQAENKPGLALTNDGTGRVSYISTGANDDRIVGYTTNDNIVAGTDDGSVKEVWGKAPPSGFGYAVGGSTGKGGCDSILYKINLATGAATAVGEIKLDLGFLKVGGLDIESLSLNPKDGQLYGFASKFGILDALVKIDPLTAKTTYIKLNCNNLHAELQDMAFDAAGNLFLAAKGDFLKVDTTTGKIATVGNNTLDAKIAALAINPDSGKVYGLAETNKGTTIYEIDKATGKALTSWKVTGTDKCSNIEGMSFDSAGNLFAVDRVTGTIFRIDVVTHAATAVSQTLTDGKMFGDGFEALAIRGDADKMLTGLKAVGGDDITTGGGGDHLWYKAGDGVDKVRDFDVAADTLHLGGYTAAQLKIEQFEGSTYIRFIDTSPDGLVDNAMIQLEGVTGFDPALIKYDVPVWSTGG